MRHNVLIVDDEQLLRQGLRARIEYLGIDVDEIFEADNGLMALGIQDEHPIDLVITDIRMPDMDGLELIQEMQKKNNQIKFIVLSGYAEFSYAETAIRLGVKAYLLKPVSNDDLKDAFDKAYQEMEQTASIRQEVQMKKRMDREKHVYQQEKALNALFSSRETSVITREQLCIICGCDEQMWGRGQIFYLDMMKKCGQGVQNRYFIWRFCTSTRKALSIRDSVRWIMNWCVLRSGIFLRRSMHSVKNFWSTVCRMADSCMGSLH